MPAATHVVVRCSEPDTADPCELSDPAGGRPPAAGSTHRRQAESVLRRVLADGGPQVRFQPQLSLSRLTVTGYEALARFPREPIRGTEQWFALAAQLRVVHQVEVAALRRALTSLPELPPGATLALNVSPGLLAAPHTAPLVADVLPDDLHGIEVELTEQAGLPGGTDRLRQALRELRARGARIAIDDVGVAHSGLRRVIELEPDCIKIDRHLVLGVAASPTKAALVRTVVELAGHLGATVCAEGVETVEDLLVLAELDVDVAQGWLVGPAGPGFGPARPEAIAAAGGSLRAMLSGRPGPGRGGPLQVDLLPRLAEVADLPELAAVIAAQAGPLGADAVVLSPLDETGSAVRALTWPHRADDPGWCPLSEHPLAARCLREQQIVPVCSGSSQDDARWRSLRSLGFTSALLVPVLSRGRSVALLECLRRTDTLWSRREIRQAGDLAALSGPTLDLLLMRRAPAAETRADNGVPAPR